MNQKGFISFLAIILIVIVIIAGAAYLTGKGSGKTAEENRTVSGFKRITLNGLGNLHVNQGGEENLRIEAEDNILNKIITEVKGDTLEIKYKNHWLFLTVWPTEDVNFYIDVKELEYVKINGSGLLDSSNLKSNTFGIEINGSGKTNLTIEANKLTSKISGSGEFNLKGTATSQELDISGSGKYLARELISKSADIEISGSGNAELSVADELKVKISGSGTVKYLGTPRIDQEISGSGKIERLE